VAIGFFLGAGAMALGGLAELRFGVRAEQQSLEAIATPLSAEEAERVNRRGARRRERDRTGLRRVRPGSGRGSTYYSPGMVGTAGAATRSAAAADRQLDREIEQLVRALYDHGVIDRRELRRLLGAGGWGPLRFGAALRFAVEEGRVSRVSRKRYGPPGAVGALRTAPRGRPA
jgi:hypothetical protein